jgi:hypothetical protein
MASLSFFDPRKYRLLPLDAAMPNPSAAAPEAAPATGVIGWADSGPEFDPGPIDVTMPRPEPGQSPPSKWRAIAASLPRHMQAGIDAAAVPNIAGGGGADIMRGLAHSQDRQWERDMAAEELDRRRRMEAAQIEENRAQADMYRRRAENAAQGAWVNNWDGTQYNTVTGEKRAGGGVTAAQAKAAAEQQKIAERRKAAEAAGYNLNDERVLSWINGANNALVPPAPKTGIRTGAQGQSVFFSYDKDGKPQFNAELPGPPKMSIVRGEQNQSVAIEQRPGQGMTIYNSTPGVPPRQPANSGGGGAAPSRPREVDGFINRLMQDAQKRGVDLPNAINAAENMANYTDVPPAIKMEAAARLRRQLVAATPKPTAASSGPSWSSRAPRSVAVTAAGLGGGPKGNVTGPKMGEERMYQGAKYRFDGMRWVEQN